jgi:peptidoglycan/xylan/chitin deacetylase (PgdA/CDA1 family)
MGMKGTWVHGAGRVIRRLARHLPRAGPLALIAAVTLAVSGPLPVASAATRPVPPGLGGRNWTAVPTNAKVVALTFDAGANADGVQPILGTLAKYHVPATFFLTGNFVRDFPGPSKAIAAAGQRLGNHSVSHPYFTKLTDAQIRDQVLSAGSRIASVTGADPWPWFRFPFGDYNQHTISVVNGTGFVPVGWTVDSLGWKGTSGGITAQTVVNRVLGSLRPGEIVLMHCGSNPDDHSTLDADALPSVIQNLKARGYSFVTIDALMGLGYHLLTSNGGVHNYGTPWYGSDAGKLPAGVTAIGIAADPKTGGYWIAKSDGGVDAFNAPWRGSMRGQIPAGQAVSGIAGTANGGYLVLTSDGGVHNYGTPWYGSDAGKLPAGVTAIGIAADPKTGGYRIAKSDGGVDAFNAPWAGSMRGQLPVGVAVTGIAGTAKGGYLMLTSEGGVHNYGTPWHGSDVGKLPTGVTATGLAADPVTSGYWILKSNGGVDAFAAPWYGSMAGQVPAGQSVTGIAGE